MGTVSLVFIAACLVVASACGDDGDPSESSFGANESYAVLSDEAWSLREAIDPPDQDPIAALDRPPIDWYAEYTRSSPDASQMVRLSGHRVTFDDARTELEGVGFAFDAVDVDGWQGVGGISTDPAGPAIVLLEHGPTSFMALSYDVPLDDLVTLAGMIEAVDETAWVNAGGVVR